MPSQVTNNQNSFPVESWMPITDMPDYEVSDKGRIRSTGAANRLPGPIKTQLVRGYPAVSIRGKTMYVHRLVASRFKPNHKGLKEVNHIDGNKQNARAQNLEWCTRTENMHHAIRAGLFNPSLKGSMNPYSKLSESDVFLARKMFSEGVRQVDVARKLGVSPTCINDLKKGKTWTHVK